MKQDINLYKQIPEDLRLRLPLNQMLQILGLSVCFMVILLGVQMCSNQTKSWELKSVIEEKAQARRDIVKLKRQYPKIAKNISLEAQKDKLNTLLYLHKVMSKDLNGSALSNDKGFTDYFTAFSKHIVDNVWLREINIQRGGGEITLNGITAQVSSVRTFIKELSEDPIFKGFAFKLKRLETSISSPGNDDFSIIVLPDVIPGDDVKSDKKNKSREA